MQVLATHAPPEQACEGRHVWEMVSLRPVASHSLTFKPSQRVEFATHIPPPPAVPALVPPPTAPKPPKPPKLPKLLGPLLPVGSCCLVPLQAANDNPKPMIAPTLRAMLFAMTLLPYQEYPHQDP